MIKKIKKQVIKKKIVVHPYTYILCQQINLILSSNVTVLHYGTTPTDQSIRLPKNYDKIHLTCLL